jgi:hypothetical protein
MARFRALNLRAHILESKLGEPCRCFLRLRRCPIRGRGQPGAGLGAGSGGDSVPAKGSGVRMAGRSGGTAGLQHIHACCGLLDFYMGCSTFTLGSPPPLLAPLPPLSRQDPPSLALSPRPIPCLYLLLILCLRLCLDVLFRSLFLSVSTSSQNGNSIAIMDKSSSKYPNKRYFFWVFHLRVRSASAVSGGVARRMAQVPPRTAPVRRPRPGGPAEGWH